MNVCITFQILHINDIIQKKKEVEDKWLKRQPGSSKAPAEVICAGPGQQRELAPEPVGRDWQKVLVKPPRKSRWGGREGIIN